MDTNSVEQQSHSNFDNVRLSEEQSDGSVADVEDDPNEIPKTKVQCNDISFIIFLMEMIIILFLFLIDTNFLNSSIVYIS